MMSKGLRLTLWTLSSLAVLWTLLSLTLLAGMVGMMADSAIHGGMMNSGRMMGGGMLMTGMLNMALVWLVMLGLDGLFVYLIATRRVPRQAA